ncbi:MAG: divalent-cation tolerance protein CutA [Coxiellaceae bacterium]|nr:MAG: divalent-cation tolerance protein CutA [Coxiellaceae bacterium]
MSQALYQLILCTCPDKMTAERLANLVINNQLAACVNIIGNITSVYHWEGNIATNDECLLLIKTSTQRYALLEKTLKAAHPYDVPEIIAIDIQQGLPAYLDWISLNVK